MSKRTPNPSPVPNSEADLLEKIRLAEQESTLRIESAKKEADAIIARAREQSDILIRRAEETARSEREKILSEGRHAMKQEIDRIYQETDRNISVLKEKSKDAKENLKQLVLSILEE